MVYEPLEVLDNELRGSGEKEDPPFLDQLTSKDLVEELIQCFPRSLLFFAE